MGTEAVTDLTVPPAAVEAVPNSRWGNEYPLAAHAEHQYDGACAVCRPDQPGNIARVLATAAPFIAATVLRDAAADHRPVVSPGAVGIGLEPDIQPGALRCSLCDRSYPCREGLRLQQLADRLVPPEPDTREGILAAAGLTEEDMQERPVRVIENFRLESYGPDPYGMGAVISVTREAGEEQADG